jgi:hypothetical protein
MTHEADRHGDKAKAIEELTAQLDEPGRRKFVSFNLDQRRSHLHRLFLTVSRRATLARLTVESSTASAYARQIRQTGHEDEEVCRGAAKHAQYLSSMPSGVVERNPAVAELVRAAEGAAESARLTADDIAAHNGIEVTVDAALASSANSLLVVSTAYLLDARSSGRMGMAVAMTNAQVAVNIAQGEQLKWLERYLRGEREAGKRRLWPF